jgi:hypothetical protein
MFSRSNHHHQNEQRFTTGRRRPRSDSPPRIGRQDELKPPVDLSLTTISPKSGRTTKRGRATSSKQPARPDTPPTPTPTPRDEPQRAESPSVSHSSYLGTFDFNFEPVEQPLTPVADVFDAPGDSSGTISGSSEANLKLLESLLGSALAIMPLLTSTQTPYTDPIREAVRLLTEFVQDGSTDAALNTTLPPPATTDQRFTYAQATKQPASHPRPAHKNKARRTAAPSTSNADNHPINPPTHRLLLRWPTSVTVPKGVTPRTIVDMVNTHLPVRSQQPVRVVAANWSRNGSLILHTQAPSTAGQLKAHATAFLSPLSELLQRQDRPEPELDVPWTGVVVHDVPGDQLLSDIARGKQYEEVGDSMGAERSQLKDVRVLCRQEEFNARTTFSVRLMLTDDFVAQRAIRHGVFLYGTHCRVSRYRRRTGKLTGVPSVGVPS